jgi:hypothetical protein
LPFLPLISLTIEIQRFGLRFLDSSRKIFLSIDSFWEADIFGFFLPFANMVNIGARY